MHHITEEIAHGLITDPHAYSRRLIRQRDAMLEGRSGAESPRALIKASWRRCLSAQVDPESAGPPIVWNTDALAYRQTTHPLASCVPLLRRVLLSLAAQAQHIMIVTDANGHILWCEGDTRVRDAAENVGLTPGTLWSEEAIGTNAMGTTLVLDRPVQVYSAEHLVRTYTDWTCAAAPVHDPHTGGLIGAIDISGPLHTIHPTSVALVSAAAQLAEQHLSTMAASEYGSTCGDDAALLGVSVASSDSRGDDLAAPVGRRGLGLRMLGGHPHATVDGVTTMLRLRHAEILFILATHPAGLTAEQIAAELYGDAANPTSVRAEVHRLRLALGGDLIDAKPYRITAAVTADFVSLHHALRAGRIADAVAAFTGPLLPRSEALVVRQHREEQIAALRKAALRQSSIEPLWKLAQHEPYNDDPEVLYTLHTRLPYQDTRRWWINARLDSIVGDDSGIDAQIEISHW